MTTPAPLTSGKLLGHVKLSLPELVESDMLNLKLDVSQYAQLSLSYKDTRPPSALINCSCHRKSLAISGCERIAHEACFPAHDKLLGMVLSAPLAYPLLRMGHPSPNEQNAMITEKYCECIVQG